MSVLAFVSGSWFLQVGGLSLALLAALFVLRRLRVGSAGGERGRTVMLTGQHALHVVQIDGRRMVIGTGPSGAPRFVCDLPESGHHGS